MRVSLAACREVLGSYLNWSAIVCYEVLHHVDIVSLIIIVDFWLNKLSTTLFQLK